MPVKILGFDRTKKKLTTMLNDELFNKEVLNEVGIFSTKRIQQFVRKGQSLVNERNFKALQSLSVVIRRSLARFNDTSRFFRVARSNLHFTGQLIESLDYVVRLKKRIVEVRPTGPRLPYVTGPKGNLQKDFASTNVEVAERLADDGRAFIGMDKEGEKLILQKMQRHLRRQLKKNRLK